MFKDFELPFVPTLLAIVALLIAVCVIWDIPGHPVESMHQLEQYDAELFGNTVVVDRDHLSERQRAKVEKLARAVGNSRYDFKQDAPIEFKFK